MMRSRAEMVTAQKDHQVDLTLAVTNYYGSGISSADSNR